MSVPNLDPIRSNDDAPRDPNNRNLEAIRQSVINNTRGNQDWLDVDAQDAMETDFTRAYQAWVQGMITEQRNSNGPAAEFEDLHHAAIIGGTLSALTGNQSSISVDQERLRQWSYVFRLRFIGENPASVIASMIRDDVEAANNGQVAQVNNGPEDDNDEPEIIDLTEDSDDEPNDEPEDSNDED